jgi:hypothetical protein
VSARIGRTKFAFVSSVVYPTPSGSRVCTAQPVAESTSVRASPPCTTPSGLTTNSDDSPSNTACPSPISTRRNPSVAPIGGCGILPSTIAWRYSRPLAAPEAATDTGSDHV